MATAPWEQDFTAYFTARAAALRRLAYAICGNWHTAEDMVQATFVQLYRHWRGLRQETVDAYARRALVNACLSHRRNRSREWVTDTPPDQPAEPGADTAARVDLARALAELPARQRAMVVLRHLEDLSVAEVAAILGIAEGTVKSQTARGVEALRGRLATPALTKTAAAQPARTEE